MAESKTLRVRVPGFTGRMTVPAAYEPGDLLMFQVGDRRWVSLDGGATWSEDIDAR